MKNWRDDYSLQKVTVYRLKFAYYPITINDGTQIWLKPYYKKYIHYGREGNNLGHVDFIENISEEEYVVRKLSGDVNASE